ncbi:bifunctional [glutamate--ammonia ligase]-adenylyl-L-tyrosine phosphorylase/[glutamate--ammonia-ligase] adenylyltransferase [Carnimonas nigrificans]|uniref:bifunctional [glutamate--ammonia ligase]-adenylyl-L-tyrosine phosphorylase/[glutamate--ammonia-ligase] adenylyltransferase n=1 Tax=Carnimonas nigrificans TaxID=64323 RepID=UPI0004B8049F|nr:bifunctional [glutamate--ammonia ligase]-adenylyl-L-tyrosine phosphorylase/[glutamate--ammonia-ligase] adenylyltransferase [Carnimonas nigrificans]
MSVSSSFHAPDAVRQRLVTATRSVLADIPLASPWRTSPDLLHVTTVSLFVLESLQRDPELLERLEAGGELHQPPSREHMRARLNEALSACHSEDELAATLRKLRREWMVGIIWRDLCRDATQGNVKSAWDTAAAVSQLADVMVQGALGWLEAFLAPRWGRAWYKDGGAMSLIVLGMGKLGAGELNLSSDIDLIFAYTHDGDTQGGKRSLAHLDYFTRIGQKLIRALDSTTMDGFVFRVDMRLRPLGEGSPLVASFASLDRYYLEQGREWERFALVKARPIAGDIDAGQALLERLSPFIYRRYIDYGAIQSLRDTKAMINREVRRRGLHDNIKLGAGGIREAEFVVQVFQLVRGGRDTELQTPSLRQAMATLGELELLPGEQLAALEADYLLLRDSEHALQALDDRQTQDLPDNDEDRERLAIALGRASWPLLEEELSTLRQRVHGLFDAVISSDEEPQAEDVSSPDMREWRALWQGDLDETEAAATLSQHGFVEPLRSLSLLKGLANSHAARAMQRIGQQRLDALMPLLLASIVSEYRQTMADADSASAQHASSSARLRVHYRDQPPDVVLARILPLVEAVLRRTAYLSLLRESDAARIQLIRLCAASPWVAEELARYPHLLDELLTPATLYTPPDRESLTASLDMALLRIPEEDEEAQLEALRMFKHAQVLSVAASDLAGLRPLMQVSDALTLIAEVIVERVLQMAWRRMVGRYGQPQSPHQQSDMPGLAVIGYGKLGGIELGYGSDLDLVFIHNATTGGVTDGPRQLDNNVFFTRLGQRIIHMLTVVTPSGVLYEVDMRLRPSGNSGLLVSSLSAFGDYQRQHAWTWEHQALVRARAIAGHPQLRHDFEQLRRDILTQPRERTTLRQEVVSMRHKMREHLSSAKEDSDCFNLKQDAGGMVDIEFIDQYAVLAFASEYPALCQWSDNVRILEALSECGCWPGDAIKALHDAYLHYRDANHLNALAKRSSRVAPTAFKQERERVTNCWQCWMEEGQVEAGFS